VKYLINIIRFTYTLQFPYSQLLLSKLTFKSQLLIGNMMTTHAQTCTHNVVGGNTRIFDNLVNLLRGYAEKLKLKCNIDAERQQLLAMSDAMLSDIGIDRVQATQEATRTDIPLARLEILGMEKY
jgi:uncharacterized protein YjiS (DUF1127 family)